MDFLFTFLHSINQFHFNTIFQFTMKKPILTRNSTVVSLPCCLLTLGVTKICICLIIIKQVASNKSSLYTILQLFTKIIKTESIYKSKNMAKLRGLGLETKYCVGTLKWRAAFSEIHLFNDNALEGRKRMSEKGERVRDMCWVCC